MKKKIILVFLLIATILSSYTVIAYYTALFPFLVETQLATYSKTTDFYLSGTSVSVNSTYYNPKDDVFTFTASEPTAVNYIGKLTARLTVRSTTATRVRVRIVDEWVRLRTTENPITGEKETTETLYSHELDPNITNDWYHPYNLNATTAQICFFGKPITGDEGINEQLIYFKNVHTTNINHFFLDSGKPVVLVPSDDYKDEIIVRLNFQIELVQANRFPQVWNLPTNFFENR